jgi:capsular exopolysaccharide synthesis family protein
MGTIPKVDGWKKRQETELVARDAPRSGAAEAYRALRANLQFLSREEDARVIAVTSPHLGDGKTTTVANIAVTLAQSGKRVIAVSCDLRKPRLHKFFGLTNDIGVSSVLTGEARAPDATLNPQEKNLRVLPSGPIPENPAELLGSDAMQALIDMLRDSADFVIIDTPPLMAVADALIVGPRADGVLVVVDATNTNRGAAASVREQLTQVGTRILGGVINSFDAGHARYESEEYRYHDYYEYREEKTRGDGDKSRKTDEDDGPGPVGNGKVKPSKTEDIWS